MSEARILSQFRNRIDQSKCYEADICRRASICKELLIGLLGAVGTAGLLHHIGRLYIFTKYDTFSDLLSSKEARQQLIDEWEAPIGESIVSNWDFSSDIRATFVADESDEAQRRVEPNLADVVSVAKNLLNGEEIVFAESRESRRLKLSEEEIEPVVVAYQKKLESMAAAIAA